MEILNRLSQRQLAFLAIAGAWMLFMVWSMAIFVPQQSATWHGLMNFCSRNGISVFLPAKVFHFCSYTVWALLALAALAGGLFFPVRSWSLWKTFVAIAAWYVVAPEILQLFNMARNPSLFDVLINSGGVLVGVVTHLILTYRMKP